MNTTIPRSLLLSTVAALLFLAGTMVSRGADTFAIVGRGNGELVRLNLTTGTRTLIKANSGVYSGLAFNADQTVLYGIVSPERRDPAQLVRIDPVTGVNTPVGGNSGVALTTLTSLADGRLYSVGYDSMLYQINPTTGTATPIGSTRLPDLSDRGRQTLEFFNSLASDGTTLYYTLEVTSGNSPIPPTLYRLDLQTGEATVVRPILGVDQIVGSAFAGPTFGTGRLYGFSLDTYTYTIDVATGAASRGARNFMSNIYGGVGIITFVPPIVALADVTSCQGEAVTLVPAVSGQGPFTYQWRRNGLDIPGATDATLGPVTSSGSYSVTVCNQGGCTGSRAAHVTFSQGPQFLRQPPAAITAFVGAPVYMDVVVTGGVGPLFLQWTRNDQPLSPIDPLDPPYLSIESAQASDTGTYRVVVSDGVCTITSAPCVLTIATNIDTECVRLRLSPPQRLGQNQYRVTISRADGLPFYTSSPPVLDVRSSGSLAMPWNEWSRLSDQIMRIEGGRLLVDHTSSNPFQFYRVADWSTLRFDVPATTNFGGLGVGLPGRFAYPQGMALGVDGELHIVDNSNQRVQVFDRNTLTFKRLYATNLFYPRDVAVDATGYSYVIDYGGQRISVYAPDGIWVREFPLLGTFPEGLSIDPTTGNLVVAEDSSGDARISVWTTAGALVRSWAPTTGAYDTWVSASGEVFAATYGGICRYSNTGALLGQFSLRHAAAALGGDDAGILYVTYFDHESVDAYSLNGELQASYVMPSCSLEQPYSGFAFGVTYSGPNRLFVTDRATHSVARLNIVRKYCSANEQ